MNTADMERLNATVAEAARVANANEATRVRHLEQLQEATNRAVKLLDAQGLDASLASAWHTYSTSRENQVVYSVELAATGSADVPKSPSQISQACTDGGVPAETVDYAAADQTYKIVFAVNGQAATRRSRRLRDEDPDFQIDDTAVPSKLARLLDNTDIGTTVKQRAGIVRSPAVRSLKIQPAKRFRETRAAPKKLIAKPGAHKKETSGAKSGGWFGFLGWFGRSLDKDIADQYQDEHDMFAY